MDTTGMRAKRKLLTWPRAVIGWALLCTVLYLWVVVDAALNEAECNAEGNWFCDPEFAAVVGGIVYFELFLIGLVAIGIAWILHALLRRRDARRR
jgi:hypothetical protein